MPGGGIPALDELCRQIPLDLPYQKIAATTPRHSVSFALIETERTSASVG